MDDQEVSVESIGEAINSGSDIAGYEIAILKKLAIAIAFDNTKAVLYDKILTHLSKEEGVLKSALKKEITAAAKEQVTKALPREAGDYVLPESYYLDKGLLYKTTKEGYQLISEYCIVNEIHQTTDRKESVISLLFPRRYKTVQIDTEEFVDNKRLEAKLINYDVYIGENIAKFRSYISSFINYNEDSIKKVVLTSSTGWQFIDVPKYENGEIVRVNTLRYCNPILENSVEYVDAIQDRIYKEGDIQTALEILNMGLRYKGSSLSILSSLAASLIYPLRKKGLGNFITNFAGTSGKGKTLSARIGLSMYGNSAEGENSLASNMNATSVGNEIKFNQNRDMPTLLDEAGTNKGSAEVKARNVLDTIFQFFSGQGRSRATKTLKLRDETVFRGVLLMTMEYDLQTMEKIAKTQEKGYFRRTIEVFSESDDFLPSKELYNFETKTNNTFGHVAEIFIRSITKDFHELENDFSTYESEYSKPELRGKEKYFSALRVTLEQLKRLKLIDQHSYEAAIKHIEVVFAENLEVMADITAKADKKWAQQLIEFVAMHNAQFESNENEVKGIKLGIIKEPSTRHPVKELRMFPTALEDFLVNNGINQRAFLKKMAEEGVLKTETFGDKQTFKIKRDNQRMYVFDFEKLNKYDDEIVIEYVTIKTEEEPKNNIVQIMDEYYNLDEEGVEAKLTKALHESSNKNIFIMELEKATAEFVVEFVGDRPIKVDRIPF